MNSYGRMAGALLVGLLAACSSVTGPPRAESVEVEFTFGVHRLAHEPPFLVSMAEEGLRIRGFLRTPCHPYRAEATAERQGETLILRVVGRDPEGCWDAVSDVGYEAVLPAIPSGVARLRIVHTLPDTNWPRIVAHEGPLPGQ